MKKLFLIFFVFISNLVNTQNLSTLGPYLKDDNSNNVILKGINLGGWMLQEPYLFQFTGAADSQHEFKEKLVEFKEFALVVLQLPLYCPEQLSLK